jgi:5-methylcytosine-specific restriction endonuclease McrA
MKRSWTEAREKVDHEGACRVCGRGYWLEAAHVIPRSLGGGQEADATVPLCSTCHAKYDGGRLDLLPVLSYEEQAHAAKTVGLLRALQRICPDFNPKRP